MLGDSNQTPKLHFIDVEILIGELSRWFDYSASTYLLFIIAFLLLLSLGLRYSAPFFYFILPPSLSIIPSTSFLAYNSVGSSQSNLLINQPNQNLMESFCKSPVVAAAHTFSNLEHNNQTVWQSQSPSSLCQYLSVNSNPLPVDTATHTSVKRGPCQFIPLLIAILNMKSTDLYNMGLIFCDSCCLMVPRGFFYRFWS